MEINRVGTLKVLKNIFVVFFRFLFGLSGVFVRRIGCYERC